MDMLSLIAVLALAPAAAGWTGQQPQLAGSDRRAFAAFVRDNTIVVLRSTDGGRVFEEVAAITPAGTIAAGMRRGPRIAVTDHAVVITAIVGAQGGGTDGDVVLYRSTDEGRSWSNGVTINDVPGAAREGLHAMASNAHGLIGVAWLDLRQPGMRVFSAASPDEGATWSPDVLVYESPSGSVCECCHPSVVVSPEGRVGVMFRNELRGHRDMHLAWSRGIPVRGGDVSFEPPTKLGEGTWPLQACPMDGGGVAWSDRGAITAWRREDAVFLAVPDRSEVRIGGGRQPAIAASGAEVDVAWTSDEGLLLRRGERTTLIGPGRFPSVLAFNDYTLLAWEHDGTVGLRRVDR